MWMFVMMFCLLDQNQALPWEHSSLQLLLQQVDQTAPSPSPDVGQQTSSSSSSSSSSSVSSESSQSSEGPQELSELQQLENTAVEHMDLSLESSELLPSPANSSLWINQLLLLGERAGERDDSEDGERRHQSLLLNFELQPQPGGPGLTEGGAGAEGDGDITRVGGVDEDEGVVTRHEGGDKGGEEVELNRLMDNSAERYNRLTMDSPGHAHHYDSYHGNEEELELGL